MGELDVAIVNPSIAYDKEQDAVFIFDDDTNKFQWIELSETDSPTTEPTMEPTSKPSESPTTSTLAPTHEPTLEPTSSPTLSPTLSPTEEDGILKELGLDDLDLEVLIAIGVVGVIILCSSVMVIVCVCRKKDIWSMDDSD